MNRLRTRLMFVFLAATLVPVAATLLITYRLLERSISLNPTRELDEVSRALEQTGRALYQTTCDSLRAEVDSMRLPPQRVYETARAASWPDDVRAFYESEERERFHLTGPAQDTVEYLVRAGDEVRTYTRRIAGPGMRALAEDYARARGTVASIDERNLRRGFTLTLVILAAGVWAISLLAVWYLARRISGPMEQLTAGLAQLAGGNLDARLDPRGEDEVSAAMNAFNRTAEELRQSRDKLVEVTRLESWQTLARKMAHEVKNSLTPIRLTMEEVAARRGERDDAFIEQAAQIVVEEVGTLERRVRAFTQFAAEPPLRMERTDVRAVVEERLALLRTAHPEVSVRTSFAGAVAGADLDLLRGILTNLLENAAQAAGERGSVSVRTFADGEHAVVEVHDSGPGLSDTALASLFEPTISFKKAGMGLGLSIAKRNATRMGGDIVLIEGELGGAAFRVLLPLAEDHAATTARTRS